MGRGEMNAVRSLLRRALEHLLKAAAWPDTPTARRWVHEAGVFLDDARDAWAPSMAQRIVLGELYAKALAHVRDLAFEEGPPAPLPETCPVTLGDLITGDILRDLAPRFRPPA